MTLYAGADASQPGNPLPPGTRIVAGYIGALDLPGQPDTPHIWTLDEWNLYLDPASQLYGGPELRALPIYVHDFPGIPETDAANAIDAVTDLGWSDRKSRIIAWDAEFLSDDAYAASLRRALHRGGFRLMTYEQTPLQDPSTDFRWIFRILPAHARPPRALPAGWDGWQWTFGARWDGDVFSAAVYDGCGRGPRRARS